MDKDTAVVILSKIYNINVDVILNFLENLKEDNENEDEKKSICQIILPFCGNIYEDRCKGIVFNHGLYTQCCKKSKKEYCSSCINLKYGNIYDRKSFKIGEFKTKEGKCEISYLKFVKKMNYNITCVIDELKKHNISIPGIEELKECSSKDNSKNLQKRGRGRPKKLEMETEIEKGNEEDMIEVVEVTIDSIKYYKTKENIILDIDTHRIIGHLKNNKIEELKL
jgi:hypothetical protein